MKQHSKLLVACIAFAGLAGIAMHLIGIGQPFLGNFAQHQTDYATVVQRWLANGLIEPLNPVMRFLSKGNNRLFYGDFPLNITLTAWLSHLTGFSIELCGRSLTAVYFFLSLFPLWGICAVLGFNAMAAALILFFYTFSPLTLIYGQSFLLEMSAICFGIYGFYFFILAQAKKSWGVFAASGMMLSLMLATRIYFAPLLFPLALLLFHQHSLRFFKDIKIWAWGILALSLPLLWYLYASRVAAIRGDESAISDNLRVFIFSKFSGHGHFLNVREILLPIIDTLINKVLNPIGFALGLLGLLIPVSSEKNIQQFLRAGVLGYLILFLIAPRKFVEFEYYYLPLVPLWAFLAGLFIQEIMRRFSVNTVSLILLLTLSTAFSLRYAIAPILITPDEDRFVLQSAELVRKYTPTDARIIASHGAGSSFLYYTNRDGWHFSLRESGMEVVRNFEDFKGTTIERLERYRSQGASFFALADKREIPRNPDFFAYLNDHYKVIHDSEQSLIFDLRL